ncbi:MAG: alpha/beta fold hydrolase [Candidatus Tectomicrobia bacterium]|nr:alpha/beta fold hydrolase [Candidatus Tectomicrobia bacterium]
MATRPADLAALPFDVDVVTFKATDGFPLNGLLYTPTGGAATAALLVHGKTCNLFGVPGGMSPRAFATAGIASFAINMRVNSLGYSRGDVPFLNWDDFQFNMAGGAWEKLEDGHKDLEAAVAYLHRLGYAKIVLVGHSSGGFYCGDYAGRAQNFDGLILLSPLMTNRYSLAAWFKDEAEAQATEQRARQMVAEGEGHLLIPLRHWYYAISAATLIDRISERPGWWDDALRKNRKPTLLLYGGTEARVKEWHEKFEKVIAAPRKEIVGIEGSEHLYLGYENQVNEAMLAFIRRHVL